MSNSFGLPLVGDHRNPLSSSLLPVGDTYMRRPDETAPKLFQLLPDSTHVPPTYMLAGAHSEHDPDFREPEFRDHAPAPSHAVTAFFTPDGKCEYQQRMLACRLCLLDDDHEFATDITAYHESKIADEFDEDKRTGYTDWVDSSFTQTTVNGFDRSVFTVRKPLLLGHNYPGQLPSRPVLVTAFALQSLPWGCLETGVFAWPDPEPGSARTVVTDVADTVTHQVDKLPQPTVAEKWPHLYNSNWNLDHLTAELKRLIAEIADDPDVPKNRPGAPVVPILNRMRAEFDITRSQVSKVLELLKKRGEVIETEAHYKRV